MPCLECRTVTLCATLWSVIHSDWITSNLMSTVIYAFLWLCWRRKWYQQFPQEKGEERISIDLLGSLITSSRKTSKRHGRSKSRKDRVQMLFELMSVSFHINYWDTWKTYIFIKRFLNIETFPKWPDKSKQIHSFKTLKSMVKD